MDRMSEISLNMCSGGTNKRTVQLLIQIHLYSDLFSHPKFASLNRMHPLHSFNEKGQKPLIISNSCHPIGG